MSALRAAFSRLKNRVCSQEVKIEVAQYIVKTVLTENIRTLYEDLMETRSTRRGIWLASE